MNINLDYEGKHYNFDIPKDVKIDYLKDLSSKLFKSDKTLLELICNNTKIDGKNENILIHDLIPKGEKSTVLTVQMNLDNQKGKEKEKEKEKDKDKDKEKKDIKKLFNLKKSTNETKLKTINQVKDNNNSKNNKLDINNKDNKDNNQIYENRIFIAKYIQKSNELFCLMKDFNDKIKEIDNNLNKKMKNFDVDCENNIFYYELSLFEKRIIDFQKRQIKYYKDLIQILNQKNEETIEPNFDIFYNKILLYNNDYSNDSIDEEKNKIKNKLLPNIDRINRPSIRKSKLHDIDSPNSILPLLKTDNYNNKKKLSSVNDLDKVKKNENEYVLKTIDRKDISVSSKNNNVMEKIKIKNIKLKGENTITDHKNNDNFGEDQEIKYQSEEANNKKKNINRVVGKKYTEKNKKINLLKEKNNFSD